MRKVKLGYGRITGFPKKKPPVEAVISLVLKLKSIFRANRSGDGTRTLNLLIKRYKRYVPESEKK